MADETQINLKFSEGVTEPIMVTMEPKYSSDQTLTPEQLQAQQDAYDQWTAPTTEPVDFAADREEYLKARQLRNELHQIDEYTIVDGTAELDADGLLNQITGEDPSEESSIDPTLF